MRLVLVTDAWRPQVNGVVNRSTAWRHAAQLGVDAVTMLAPDRFRTPALPDLSGDPPRRSPGPARSRG